MNAPTGAIAAPQRVGAATVVRFLLLASIWGSTWIVIKGQLGSVPVAWSVSYRFLLAGLAIAGLCVVLRRSLRLPPVGHAIALFAAVMQFTINFNLVYEAEKLVTSGLVALIFALIVVPNTIFARLFLGQRISGRFVLGSAIGIAGVALLVARDLDLRGGGVAAGLAMAVIAVISASVANVLQASSHARRLTLEPLLATAMIYGGLICGGYAWSTEGPPQFDTRPDYIAGLAYLALIASALAFKLYYTLIRELGPARAGYVNVVVPLVAMSMSTIFEGFRWTATAALGGVLAMVGLVVALRSRE